MSRNCGGGGGRILMDFWMSNYFFHIGLDITMLPI